MSGYAAITDVGNTLVALLQDEMTLVNDDEVVRTSPAELSGQVHPRLTLFLYRVTKNEHLQNAEQPIEEGKQPSGPLVIDLHYFLTAHPPSSSNSPATMTADQHSVLGEAMQVIHDHGILRGSRLKGDLAGGKELQITMGSEPTEELTNIWSTFENHPFRVSVAYEVGPVEIESTQEESFQRVVEIEQSTSVARPEDPDGGGP